VRERFRSRACVCLYRTSCLFHDYRGGVVADLLTGVPALGTKTRSAIDRWSRCCGRLATGRITIRAGRLDVHMPASQPAARGGGCLMAHTGSPAAVAVERRCGTSGDRARLATSLTQSWRRGSVPYRVLQYRGIFSVNVDQAAKRWSWRVAHVCQARLASSAPFLPLADREDLQQGHCCVARLEGSVGLGPSSWRECSHGPLPTSVHVSWALGRRVQGAGWPGVGR
jgi:hypothetical protein